MRPLLALLAGAAVGFAGCTAPPSSSQDGSQPVPTGPAEVRAIGSACGQCFDPPTLTIRAGERVRWVDESGSHTVTFERPVNGNGTAPESGNLDPGQTFEVTFPGPGSYNYRCRYHSSTFGAGNGMVGTVTVS